MQVIFCKLNTAQLILDPLGRMIFMNWKYEGL